MAVHTEGPGTTDEHERALAREGLASAPEERLAADADLVRLLIGGAVGLELATVPAASRFVITRLQAWSWLGTVLYTGGTLVVTVTVVVVRNALGH